VPARRPAAPRAGEVEPVDGERHGELQGDPERLDRDHDERGAIRRRLDERPEQRVEEHADKEVGDADDERIDDVGTLRRQRAATGAAACASTRWRSAADRETSRRAAFPVLALRRSE